ncbi:MAG: hypothetical protein N2652_10225 [Kiritimatiellae bacterium]|nr:hypothetical protein [Kiritimatiellia bacterium]
MLLLLILKDERRIETVVNALIELGLFDATILDGEAVENLATQTLPLFADVGRWFGHNLAYHRALLIVLPERRAAEEFVDLCARDGLNLRDPQVAVMALIPAEPFPPRGEPLG